MPQETVGAAGLTLQYSVRRTSRWPAGGMHSIPPVPAHSEQLTLVPGHLWLCVPAGQQFPFELLHLGHSKVLPVPPQHWHSTISENDEPILPKPQALSGNAIAPIDQRAPAGISKFNGRQLSFF